MDKEEIKKSIFITGLKTTNKGLAYCINQALLSSDTKKVKKKARKKWKKKKF